VCDTSQWCIKRKNKKKNAKWSRNESKPVSAQMAQLFLAVHRWFDDYDRIRKVYKQPHPQTLDHFTSRNVNIYDDLTVMLHLLVMELMTMTV
jgi:hypothetical protein